MSDATFYKNLKPVSDFNLLAGSDVYYPLPPSWKLVATDIENSTEQIAAGKFKEVNMVTASVITAISNHLKKTALPFTFAGDGALIAIPEGFSADIQAIIETCQAMAADRFHLNLAAGIVSVEELYQEGYVVTVAKVQISEHVTQAAFMGEGVYRAEEIIKERTAPVNIRERAKVDLTGLECRWNYFPARKQAISLIVQAIGHNSRQQSETYQYILSTINKLYGEEIDLKPVRQQDMKLTFSPRSLSAEIKIRSKQGFLNRLQYAIKLLYLQVAGYLLMRLNITTKNNRWGDYKSDFIKNSDHRKFSGDLKMILTGSSEKKEKLSELLEDLYQQKKIAYGMHVSTATITTCYVTDYQSNHIHFVDGADGGYTRASIDYKERLSRLED